MDAFENFHGGREFCDCEKESFSIHIPRDICSVRRPFQPVKQSVAFDMSRNIYHEPDISLINEEPTFLWWNKAELQEFRRELLHEILFNKEAMKPCVETIYNNCAQQAALPRKKNDQKSVEACTHLCQFPCPKVFFQFHLEYGRSRKNTRKAILRLNERILIQNVKRPEAVLATGSYFLTRQSQKIALMIGHANARLENEKLLPHVDDGDDTQYENGLPIRLQPSTTSHETTKSHLHRPVNDDKVIPTNPAKTSLPMRVDDDNERSQSRTALHWQADGGDKRLSSGAALHAIERRFGKRVATFIHRRSCCARVA